MDSGEDHVKQMLRVHQRAPVTLQGQSVRIERTANLPHGSVIESTSVREHLELSTRFVLVRGHSMNFSRMPYGTRIMPAAFRPRSIDDKLWMNMQVRRGPGESGEMWE